MRNLRSFSTKKFSSDYYAFVVYCREQSSDECEVPNMVIMTDHPVRNNEYQQMSHVMMNADPYDGPYTSGYEKNPDKMIESYKKQGYEIYRVMNKVFYEPESLWKEISNHITELSNKNYSNDKVFLVYREDSVRDNFHSKTINTNQDWKLNPENKFLAQVFAFKSAADRDKWMRIWNKAVSSDKESDLNKAIELNKEIEFKDVSKKYIQ